jgi:ankyrin repeat protein
MIAASLLQKGADVNQRDASGSAPLHYAAPYGHEKVVQLLLSAGADVNIKDQSGKTPFDRAVEYNQEGLARLLKPRRSTLAFRSLRNNLRNLSNGT